MDRVFTAPEQMIMNIWIACDFMGFTPRSDGKLNRPPTRALWDVPDYMNDMNEVMKLAHIIKQEYAWTLGDVVNQDRWVVHIFNEPDLPYYKADAEHISPSVAAVLAAIQLRGVNLTELLEMYRVEA